MNLSAAQISVSNNHVYCALKSGTVKDLTASGYVHPTTKQCTWTPDLSNYATKADLEEVAAPKVVGSGEATIDVNYGEPLTKNIPLSNYIILSIIDPDTGRLYRETTIYKGSSATIPAWEQVGPDFYPQHFSCAVNSAGNRLTFRKLSDNREFGYVDVNWTCYK